MALQSTININIDFYDKKYIIVNAKQNDKNSRLLLVACYNHGEFYPINADEHSAFVRYRKSDGCSVLNVCDITDDKKILVKLTEQMLASAGICYADLIVANRGSASLNPDTGEVEAVDNASILSTMSFCIDVSESVIDNTNIESTYEFDGFNSAVEKCLAEYSDVIQLAKSWAVGDTGLRNNENIHNAKYYSEQSSAASISAAKSSNAAKASEVLAEQYADNAKASMDAAQIAEVEAVAAKTSAEGFASAAQTYAGTAKEYRDDVIEQTNIAKEYKDETLEYKNQAESYKDAAQSYMSQTGLIRSEAEACKNDANDAAIRAQSYAEGGTGLRDNEDHDNVKYYYEDTIMYFDWIVEYCSYTEEYIQRIEALKEAIEKSINNSNNVFTPMGTVTYEEFTEIAMSGDYHIGDLYNISNSFITDDNFLKVGVECGAGTNVYFSADGYWHCLVTNNNIGVVSTTDVASIDEVKDYLDI